MNDILHQLSMLGISDELLGKSLERPEELILALYELSDSRAKLRTSVKKNSLKKVYQTTNGSLYHGDCLNLLQTKIKDESLDCIFADPPFNLSKNYGFNISDSLTDEDYLEWTRSWIDLSCKKLKYGGAFYVFNIPKWSVFISHYLSQKLNFKNWIAIDLTLSMPIKNKLYPSHYSLLYFIKGDKANHFSPPRIPIQACKKCGQESKDYGGYKMKIHPEGFNLRDVWTDIPPVRHSKFKTRKANELSTKLISRVLDISTKEGDLVFDPFGGAGTTYAVAEMMNRKWLGVELGDYKGIVNRLKNLEDEKVILQKHLNSMNTLFKDEDIKNRLNSGLPINNYNISPTQLKRIFATTFKED